MEIPGELIPIVLFICIAVMVIGHPIARAIGRKIDRQSVTPPGTADMTARLERMEHAIDAIAVEVERISEGQRYTTRLLAGRGRDAQPALAERTAQED